jgi:hypothetical protein
MKFEILTTLSLSVEADNESQAKYKAACFIAAGEIMYGQNDVKLKALEIAVHSSSSVAVSKT